MSERRFPVGVIAVAPIVIGFALYAFTAQGEVHDPAVSATQTAAAEPTATASATPYAQPSGPLDGVPTPFSPPAAAVEPTPVMQRGPFRDGAWVRVNAGEGDCLNARPSPTVNAEWAFINTCLPHGFEGYLTGAPAEADGHWWWMIAGAGYVAEEYLEYVRDVDLRSHAVPELAGRGRIAFIRDSNAVWLMNADGSGQRLIFAPPDQQWIQQIAWSPDGTQLAVNVSRAGDDYVMTSDIYIIDAATGAVLRVLEHAWGRTWSPDGRRIGVVSAPALDQMGGGAEGLAGWADVVSGERRVLLGAPDDRFWHQDPPAFNHDGTKLLVTGNPWNAEGDSRGFVVIDIDGNELARIAVPAETMYLSPRWSPVDDRIAFHAASVAGKEYLIYDLASASIVGRAAAPEFRENVGGRCGGGDMWRPEWSRDGRTLHYSFDMGATGQNGVWSWDIATGEQRLVAAMSAGPASAGPDGSYAFHAWGYGSYIFAASGNGFPLIITDGHSPAWAP